MALDCFGVRDILESSVKTYSRCNRFTIYTFLALLFIFNLGNLAKADGNSVITLEQLNLMFAEMRANPAYKKGTINGDLLWGYFFTDPDPKKLQPVADYLTKNGYRFVEIYPTDDKTTYFLHAERVEHHAPQS